MRHIKPQAALIATTRTQIGSRPMLAISIGVGFRLSEPAILVHEAAVWEAVKAAAPSMPLVEAAMPKWRAEWMLAGHSVCRVPADEVGRTVDWAALAELDGVRKTVSCQARADGRDAPGGFATVAIDPTEAAAGHAGENPFGIASGTAPLQRVSTFGVRPEPLAAMGVLGTDWPERRQWMPHRPGSAEAMARDGTHMGWPESVDPRFFQQAAPDQWSRGDVWAAGAPFQLNGFGARGEGYAGTLPRLAAVALVTRTGHPDAEQVALRQQTVWLLPDSDVGVLWWNGAVTIDYVLDDAPEMLVASLKDAGERIDTGAMMAFAAQRADVSSTDPTQLADHVLMPSTEKGWAWELILDADDHPRFSPPSRPRTEIVERLERHRQSLMEARAGQQASHGLRDAAGDAAWPVAPSRDRDRGRDWRAYFGGAGHSELKDETIRDADLSGLSFDGWRMQALRFERCRFDRSIWRNSRLIQVHMVDCSFVDAVFDGVIWHGGALVRSLLRRGAWNNVELERVSIDECGLDALSATGGAWSLVTVQGGGGEGGTVRDVAWTSVSWNRVDARRWAWVRVQADSLAIVECEFAGLALAQCKLAKPSVLLSDLTASTWQQCTLSFAVLSHRTSIDRARVSDCVFQSSSFQDLHADALRVEHCSFVRLNAQHLKAERSIWSHTVLEGANLTHARLLGASFDRCSLKEAMLYGADMHETRVRDCNLIRARMGWAHLPGAGAWRHNLNAGRLDVPRRQG
ncbi:pentapeptide repeat-containing protein [Burkholderia guangdongensis]|uniref:pentapeptide repeat-containing protein n=1 Tax=Burkholderia guangdongensis TaxID=1792500 RepID=UPI0015C9AFCC|nr:pentapeptide repeat-containing protein [Burkholderia guangdongensis]